MKKEWSLIKKIINVSKQEFNFYHNIKNWLQKIVTTVNLNTPFSGNLRETVKLEWEKCCPVVAP